MAAIRRLCDRRDDVISLPRALKQTKTDLPHAKDWIDLILKCLDDGCRHVITQTNQYIAHTADPDETRNPAPWDMQMKHFTQAHEAICKCATTFDRDVLQRQTFAHTPPHFFRDLAGPRPGRVYLIGRFLGSILTRPVPFLSSRI